MRFFALFIVLLLSPHCKRTDQPASLSKDLTAVCSSDDLNQHQSKLEDLKLKKKNFQTSNRNPTELLDHEVKERDRLVSRFSINNQLSFHRLNEYLDFNKEAILNTLQNYCQAYDSKVAEKAEVGPNTATTSNHRKDCIETVSTFRSTVDARIEKDKQTVLQQSASSDETNKAISELEKKIAECNKLAGSQRHECIQPVPKDHKLLASEIISCNPKDLDAKKIAEAFIAACPATDAKVIGTFKDPYCLCNQMKDNQSFYWSFPFHNRHTERLNTAYKGICGKESSIAIASCKDFNAAVAGCPGVGDNSKDDQNNVPTPSPESSPKPDDTTAQGASCNCKHYIAADGSKWCSAIGGTKTLGFQSEYCSASICKSLCNVNGNNCTSVMFLSKDVCK